MSRNRSVLSFQIVYCLSAVFGLGLGVLIFAGKNAITLVDEAALAQQQRFVSRSLSNVVTSIPEQQRSATVWDDAVRNTAAPDEEWINSNLGSWMQEYFGHHENYILDQANEPIFSSVLGEILPPAAYARRSHLIAPLVAQLRSSMAEVSLESENALEALAEVAVVSPAEFGKEVAIVSVVPIISDTGDILQSPGSESLHVAVRYVDKMLAQEVGQPIELDEVAFETTKPSDALASVPLIGPSGDVLSWLVWNPDRPGTELLQTMLPVLILVGLASALIIAWFVNRLLRISGKLEASEEQARLDLVELKRAREQAEAADRAKMNFLSIVSHELRTPLTVILGWARIGKNLRQMPPAQKLYTQLQHHPVDAKLTQNHVDEVLEFATTGMEKINKSGEHLLFLVNQLLDYAKMETGSLEVEPEVCDVQEVLEPVVDQMKVLAEQKGLFLETRIASCPMWADVARTRQILINLMGNAIKFTDSGSVSVVVTEAEDKVFIEVSDTGTGIAPENLEKIFVAFQQADNSLTRSATGTGLGLSVATELANLEGGAIEVRSEMGVGSTFTLSLPKEMEAPLEKVA